MADAPGPLVTVIVPTYNRPDLLRRALGSVLAQTYGDFEVIIVDDGSETDPTPVVESFADPRLRLIRQTNAGNAAARNAGIRQARGEYIAFLDDDDEWTPGKLERQVPVLRASGPDEALVYCGRRVYTESGHVLIDAPGKEGDVFDALLPGGLMSCPSVLVKAEVLEDVGLFDESLERGVDSDLWRRIARRYRVKYVDYLGVNCYVAHGERVSDLGSPERIRADIETCMVKLRRFESELRSRPTIHAQILRKLGERHLELGEVTAAWRFLGAAIRRDPTSSRTWALLAASTLGRRGLRAWRGLRNRLRPLLRRWRRDAP